MNDHGAERFFDAIARRYDRVYAPEREETRGSLLRVLRELAPRSRVLDLGIGTGRELPFLLDAGHSPVGLDVSAEMLAVCARRARVVPLVKGDLWERMPWDDSSFDAVIALHGTLSHPTSAERLATFPREVARLLRPGGVLVAEVPTRAWFDDAARDRGSLVEPLSNGRGRFVDTATGATVDAWFFSPEEWATLFERELRVEVLPVGVGEVMIVGRKAAVA